MEIGFADTGKQLFNEIFSEMFRNGYELHFIQLPMKSPAGSSASSNDISSPINFNTIISRFALPFPSFIPVQKTIFFTESIGREDLGCAVKMGASRILLLNKEINVATAFVAELAKRNRVPVEKREYPRYTLSDGLFSAQFTSPYTLKKHTGVILNISLRGVAISPSIVPDFPEKFAGIRMELRLNIGGPQLVISDAEVVELSGKLLRMKFVRLGPENEERLVLFIKNYILKEGGV